MAETGILGPEEARAPAAEWNEARAFRLGRLVVDLDAPSGWVRGVLDAELDLAARAGEILTVSRERLNEVTRRYLDPERLVTSVAGAVP